MSNPNEFVNRRSRVQSSKVAPQLAAARGPAVACDIGHAQVPENGFARGRKVRITAGQAAGTEGVLHAEWQPLKPTSWRQWVVRTNDLVERRTIREDYLEILP